MRRRQIVILLALVNIATFGWLDYVTGPDIGFSLFYLIPITATAFHSDRSVSAVVALSAASAWLLAHYFIEGFGIVVLWNGFTRMVMYLAIALLVQEVRADRRALQALLARETEYARTDHLTSLANSRWFDERLAREIQAANRAGHPLCIAYFDLDGFKSLNDIYGHHAGDDVLKDVGLALRATVRNDDLAGRLGGDEFAIIFSAVTRDTAIEIARRVQERIAEVSELYPNARIGASIGLAYFDSPPSAPDEVIRIADQAMYRAKASGKGRIVWADEEQEISPPLRR